MNTLDKTPASLPRRSLRTCAALAASLAILSAPTASRADEPSPTEIAPAPPPMDPPARSIIVIHDHDDGGTGRPTRARNMGLFVGGLGMAAAGLAAAIAGGAFLSASSPPPAACSNGTSAACAFETSWGNFGDQIAGYGLAVGGAGLIAGGLAMAIVGGWQVPITAPARARAATAVPAVAVGAQKVTLTWRF